MKTRALLSFFLFVSVSAFAQHTRKNNHSNYTDCRQNFEDVASLVPQLYESNDFDSIQRFIHREKAGCGTPTHIFAIQVLLSIQQKSFSEKDLNDTGFFFHLRNYSHTMQELKNKGRQLSYMSEKYFDATPYDEQLFGCTSEWAQKLLTRTGLDSTESFLCNVLAGNITSPASALKHNNIQYDYLNRLIERSYRIHRNSGTQNIGFTSGIWIPRGNAKVLGVHPAFGMMVGHRNKLNEFDMSFAFRFIRTPGDYTIMRGGTLYDRHHFFGGYFGLDYTRYFIHSLHFETGIIGGIGYDGFDIADQGKYQHTYDYLQPLSINSLNLNTGLRINYFFNATSYIGIAAKFNYISYKNNGGTPINGNAFTIDFTIGGN